MSTKYTYSVASDFTGMYTESPNIVKLTHYINMATFGYSLESIDQDGDNCDVWFEGNLTSEEETILDGYISSHDGYLCALGAGTIDPQGYFDESHGFLPGHKYLNNTTGDEFVCISNTDNAAVWRLSSVPAHYSVSDSSTFGTIDTDYTIASSVDVSLSGGAVYKIQWSFEALTDIGTVVHDYRVYMDHNDDDGYNILAENDIEFENSTTVVPVSGFANFTADATGSFTVSIQIKSYDGEAEVQVRRRNIDVRRIEYGNL